MISKANGNRLDKFAVSIGLDIEAHTEEAAMTLARELIERIDAIAQPQARVVEAALLFLEAVEPDMPGWVDMGGDDTN